MPLAPIPPASRSADALCPNCARILAASDSFCRHCGQRQEARVPTLRTWLGEWLEEGFGLNARIPRTLRALLFHPGQLTSEWFAGRRVRYLNAFRLYLSCSVVMFGTAIALRFVGEHWNFGYRPQGALADRTYAELARESVTHALFLLVPLSAAWLRALFPRSGRVFIEHLVFSLHVHAFGFLAAAASFLMILAPGGAARVLQPLCAAGVFVYLVLALRRVYETKLVWAVMQSALLLIVHGAAVLGLTLGLTALRHAQ